MPRQASTDAMLSSCEDHRITTYHTNHLETNFSRAGIQAVDGNSDPTPYAINAIRLYTALQRCFMALGSVLSPQLILLPPAPLPLSFQTL